MNTILKTIVNSSGFKSAVENIKNSSSVYVFDAEDLQRPLFIYAASKELNRPVFVIAETEERARQIKADIDLFEEGFLEYYPCKDIVFYSADIKSTDIVKERFEVIKKLRETENQSAVISVDALFDRLVKPSVFSGYIKTLKTADTISIDSLARELVFMGYERCSQVEGQGQFAIRGGIIDIFGATMKTAVRIELWGDEIDSIRLLDSFSQRSADKCESVDIMPMRELVYNENQLSKAVEKIKEEYCRHISTLNPQARDTLEYTINGYIDKLENQSSFCGIDKFFGYFCDESYSILDYIGKNSIIVIDSPSSINRNAERFQNAFCDSIMNRIENGYMLPSQMKMIYSYEEMLERINSFDTLCISSFVENTDGFDIKHNISLSISTADIENGSFYALRDKIEDYLKNDYTVIYLAGSGSRAKRLADEISQTGIDCIYAEDIDAFPILSGKIYTTKGNLRHGFEYADTKTAILSDLQSTYLKKKKTKSARSGNTAAIESFTDLNVGDYVVHENHGIGIFKGIEKVDFDGILKDYIKLGYSDESTLYISVNQLDMIQKYIGSREAPPKINKLGSSHWEKSKQKAKKAAKLLAEELIKIYAQREASKGFVYSSDTVWQSEFENSFPFEETDDQLNAVEDIKNDMESSKVMDRLICGDVGFGKTEVAVRAAFKAVQDSKQVAFLVPTTILAQQHYSNFLKRFSDFPINIEMLSRFRTPTEQKKILSRLENGDIDILVGTHKILGKSVHFKDLGLIIVDEEQRFGVAQKDKFKKLKENVDMLTLSATPIPRTLNMSMTGIRDMSLLTQPPRERMPVQTYVMEYNPEIVRDAIKREVSRGGQVYYLYNRVETIDEITHKIQALVPNINVCYAHGQMSERELEKIMSEFMDNEIQVLVCTTIIETGLDIPNVNTMIIHNSDKMGLSQLYQLRGRVGRSNRTSFAYLMYQNNMQLNETASKRLQAIKDFTEFGSGFKVAMRDLEIRGAGNLLGSEQHGHMDSIGYDMYCKLLDRAIKELKGEKVDDIYDLSIDLSVSAYIPPSYIEDEQHKLEMYKKISSVSCERDMFDIQEELEDRFGDLPKPTQNLLDIALMKTYAKRLGIESIKQRKDKISIILRDNHKINLEKLMALMMSRKYDLKYSSYLVLTPEKGSNPTLTLMEIFKEIGGKGV